MDTFMILVFYTLVLMILDYDAIAVAYILDIHIQL